MKEIDNKKREYTLMINVGWCLIGLRILILFGLIPFYPHLMSIETYIVACLILFEVFFMSGLCLLSYGTEKLETLERNLE
jgi:hypothetical protein